MGNKSQKKTNEMLGQQTAAANQFANTQGQRAAQEYGYGTGSRGKIDQAYWDLYGGIGQGGGGGGGGPAYNPLQWANARENEALGGFRNLRDTGGWSDPQQADFRARATSVMPSFFEGLKNQLSSQNVGLAGNVGYGSQMSKLAREGGRSAAEAQLNAEVDLQDKIRQGKLQGLQGVGTYDTEYMKNQQRVEELRNQELRNQQAAAAASAGRGRASAEQAFRDKMGILNELRGLRGEQGTDLPYSAQQLAGINAGTGSVNARVNEPSFLQSALGAVKGVAGAVAPFINPAANLNPFKKAGPSYQGYAG